MRRSGSEGMSKRRSVLVVTEDDEDLRVGLDEARREWERKGGVEAGEFFRDVKAGPKR